MNSLEGALDAVHQEYPERITELDRKPFERMIFSWIEKDSERFVKIFVKG